VNGTYCHKEDLNQHLQNQVEVLKILNEDQIEESKQELATQVQAKDSQIYQLNNRYSSYLITVKQ
jgi:hypothetical protein